MAKEKGPTRDSIMNEITMEELYKVTNEAWNASLGAQAKMGLNKQTNQYYRPNFKDMHLRKKQAAISENLCGILATFTYRTRFAEWALNNPGDAMRLFVALAPKTVEVDIEQRIGVLLVPKTSGSLQEWMKETNVLPPESQAHLSTNDVFAKIDAMKEAHIDVSIESVSVSEAMDDPEPGQGNEVVDPSPAREPKRRGRPRRLPEKS